MLNIQSIIPRKISPTTRVTHLIPTTNKSRIDLLTLVMELSHAADFHFRKSNSFGQYKYVYKTQQWRRDGDAEMIDGIIMHIHMFPFDLLFYCIFSIR